MRTRKSLPNEMDQIFLMGKDIWALGSEEDYLKTCHASTKYKEGTWYVLSDGDQILSSLVVYTFSKDCFGLGSIATVPNYRKMGLASRLIKDVLADIETESPEAMIFLYSDIDPAFYEKFQFVKLPQNAQKYKTTTCMLRHSNPEKYLVESLKVPDYF